MASRSTVRLAGSPTTRGQQLAGPDLAAQDLASDRVDDLAVEASSRIASTAEVRGRHTL